jgi:hypothetical protein
LGFPHLFRPRYAGANLGHPSDCLRRCYDTDSFETEGLVPVLQPIVQPRSVYGLIRLNGKNIAQDTALLRCELSLKLA